MKQCPFCAEDIQDDAIKCRFCGEVLDAKMFNQYQQATKRVPWYFSTNTIILTGMFVGPFVLPLIWLHPKYSKKVKVISTILILAITWAFAKVMAFAVSNIFQYYNFILER